MEDNKLLLIKMIAEVLDCNESDINNDSGLLTHYGWDSLNHVVIIVKTEEMFNIKIPNIMITELNTVGKIFNYLCEQNCINQ